jgi:peroxiredoxin
VERAVNRHVYTIVACGLGVAVVGANVAIKPGISPERRREVAEAVRRSRSWPGRIAPDFEIPLLDHSTFRLRDHAGRVVVLNFFSTVNGDYGNLELAELQHYVDSRQAGGNPISLVAIAVGEQRSAVQAFADRNRVRTPLAADGAAVVRLYDVDRWPATVVIGADGRVLLYVDSVITNAEVALGDTLNREFDRLAPERQR